MTMQAEPGHFYAVGIGPGAPDLITLRAARILEAADALVAPRSDRSERSGGSGQSLALRIAAAHVHDQEVLVHTYPMHRDQASTRASWAQVADWVAIRLQAGQAVAQITLGDPLLYSTSAYLMECLLERVPAERLHVVPGISAMQAAAAAFGAPLTVQEDRLTLMPATDLAAVARALDSCETLVLYKVGGQLPALRALLAERGLLAQARLGCAVEQAGREVLYRDLGDPVAAALGYLSVVLVRCGHRPWRSA